MLQRVPAFYKRQELRAGAIDVANDIAYWVAAGSPGIVYKIALDSANPDNAPTIIGSPLTLAVGEETPRSIVLDLVNGYGYVGTTTGQVVRIILGAPADAPTRERSLLPGSVAEAREILYDLATGFLYVADYNSDPSTYFKVAARAASGGGTTLIATGPKHPVARGGKAVRRLRLVAPKITAGVPKNTKAGVTSNKGNATYYLATLDMPVGATVLHASTALGAGKNNKAVITATQVYWPRVPAEGPPQGHCQDRQKRHLSAPLRHHG